MYVILIISDNRIHVCLWNCTYLDYWINLIKLYVNIVFNHLQIKSRPKHTCNCFLLQFMAIQTYQVCRSIFFLSNINGVDSIIVSIPLLFTLYRLVCSIWSCYNLSHNITLYIRHITVDFAIFVCSNWQNIWKCCPSR